MTKEILELAQQLLDAAHYCTQLEKLEDHCREVARKLEALAEDGEPQESKQSKLRHMYDAQNGDHYVVDEAGNAYEPANTRPDRGGET